MIKPGYTRVSEILGQWPQFEGIPPEIIKRKGEIGTEVHEAIMGFHNDIHLPVSEVAQGYYDSFMRWYTLCKYPMQSIGRLYCDTLKITGEIDAIIQVEGAWCLVDWKTSATANDKLWQLQGQFYQYLMKTNGHEIDTLFYFVQLDKHGSMPNVKLYQSTKDLMNVCMSAYICHKYLNKVDRKSQDQSQCSL